MALKAVMARTVRILFVAYSQGVVGSVVCLYNLVKALDRARFEPVLLVSKKNYLTHELERAGIDVHTFSPRRKRFWHNLRQIRAIIRKTRPALVHPFEELPSNTEAVLAAKLAGLPCVCQLMGENPLRKKDLLFAWMADKLVAVSEAVKRHYVKFEAPAKKIAVIHHGTPVPAAQDFDAAAEGAEFRRRHGLHPEDLVVTSAGRLVELKGFDDFLSAGAKISGDFPRARFVLAGIGPEAVRLKKHAARLGIAGKTFFVGHVRDVRQLYAASDIVVLASNHREAFSNVLLEAFVAARPCIATRVGGNPEIIDSDKVGRLVPPRNPERLAEALRELLGNPGLRKSVGLAARKRAEAALDILETAEKMMALYDRLLKK